MIILFVKGFTAHIANFIFKTLFRFISLQNITSYNLNHCCFLIKSLTTLSAISFPVNFSVQYFKLVKNKTPQYENLSHSKKKQIYGFFAICSISALMAGISLALESEETVHYAIMLLVVLSSITELFDTGKYFYACTNRRLSWDIYKGLSAVMCLIALGLSIMTDEGYITLSKPISIYFSIIVWKNVLENYLNKN